MAFSIRLDEIALSAQLASCLEVSATPKPGNIHRLRDFPETTYEQFLAGSISIGNEVRRVARRAMLAGKGRIKLSEIEIGLSLLRAVRDVKRWQSGGNTHLGTLLLFLPLACGAGVLIGMKKREINVRELRLAVDDCVKATTSKDTFYAYKAILESGMSGLCDLKEISVSKKGLEEVKRKDITLYDTMSISSKWDGIAREWVTKFNLSFEFGYKSFMSLVKEYDVNLATVHTFLLILANNPDTFIARKVGERANIRNVEEAVNFGMKEARRVAKLAKEALDLGGLKTKEGREKIKLIDDELYSKRLNPGTTADITACSIMISLLTGFKP